MELVFLEQAWEDYLYWQTQHKKVLKKINELINDIDRDPFKGIGSPEALKHDLSGYWSRRITLEHCLVYRVQGNQIRVLQCRYNY
ncbi:MAG: Txe/YoeB family addiction module toxin [Flavobacteriales bacterium]|jgi:toxin YoeB|nr:Txe/YoeB family addiction module toxin [Flavobacteriales bacterium]